MSYNEQTLHGKVMSQHIRRKRLNTPEIAIVRKFSFNLDCKTGFFNILMSNKCCVQLIRKASHNISTHRKEREKHYINKFNTYYDGINDMP